MITPVEKAIKKVKMKRELWLKDGETETLSDDVILLIALEYYLEIIENNIKFGEENNGGL